MIRWVGQEEPTGCVAATLAMLLGVTYSEAAAMLTPFGDCYSTIARQEVLYEQGWAICKKPWISVQGVPFAPMHLVSVKISEGSMYHSVVWLADGRVLDPLSPEPKSLADYHHLGGVEGLVRLSEMAGSVT